MRAPALARPPRWIGSAREQASRRGAAESPPMNAKRSIAVVLDGPLTPAWQAQALSTLEASTSAEVVEVRLAGEMRRSRTRRLRDALERRLFVIIAPDPLSPVD